MGGRGAISKSNRNIKTQQSFAPRRGEAKSQNYISMKTSLGEKLLREFVGDSFPNRTIVYNARPEFLKNIETGNNLELDIWVVESHVAFEFNGPQHKYSKERDKWKKVACRENGITLFSIRKPKQIYYLSKQIGRRISPNLMQKIYDYEPSNSAFPGMDKYLWAMKRKAKLDSCTKAQEQETSSIRARVYARGLSGPAPIAQ